MKELQADDADQNIDHRDCKDATRSDAVAVEDVAVLGSLGLEGQTERKKE